MNQPYIVTGPFGRVEGCRNFRQAVVLAAALRRQSSEALTPVRVWNQTPVKATIVRELRSGR